MGLLASPGLAKRSIKLWSMKKEKSRCFHKHGGISQIQGSSRLIDKQVFKTVDCRSNDLDPKLIRGTFIGAPGRGDRLSVPETTCIPTIHGGSS